MHQKKIALNVLYVKNEKIPIHPDYVLKHNPQRERQLVLLMIRNREGWHCSAVKKALSVLLRGIISKHNSDLKQTWISWKSMWK